MKRAISLLITLLILFNAGGGYILFRLQQSEARRESQEAINSHIAEKIVVVLAFRLNKEEGIVWMRPGREFTYKGEMYDVIKSITRGNMKYYHCYNDSREKKLIAGYQKSHHSKKETEKRRKAPNNPVFYPQKTLFTRTIPPTCFDYSLYEFCFTSEIPVTPSPPPKFA
ncbi:MAG TPA: hypothetical protein PK796_01300 [Bacteroidales bacterium]|nr:hypothetical protein [Bacteroidales bacterium]